VRLWGIPGWVHVGYLAVVVVLCKSTAAIAYALLLLPLVAWARARSLTRVARLVIVLLCSYPLLRATNLFPRETLVSWATAIDPGRAHSLEFRFNHEEALLTKANEKLWLGWGGYRRSHVFDDQGRDRSVTDGYWITILGGRGLPVMLASFALLLIPVWQTKRRLRGAASRQEQLGLAGLGLILIAYAVDLIPNGMFTILPFYLAGALTGLLHGGSSPRRDNDVAPGPAEADAAGDPVGGDEPLTCIRSAESDPATPTGATRR
jgi:hypothetical protein